jgi:type I restriction enzyme S subunit
LTTSGFLYHYLCSQKEAFIEAGKGGAQPNISQAVIKSWPIPIPPLSEQKRIANKLDALLARVDACRERLDRVPLILKRFRQAILTAATSGQLTEEWREERNSSETGQEIVEQDKIRKNELIKNDPELSKKKSSVVAEIDAEYIFNTPESWVFST